MMPVEDFQIVKNLAQDRSKWRTTANQSQDHDKDDDVNTIAFVHSQIINSVPRDHIFSLFCVGINALACRLYFQWRTASA